MSSSSDLCCVVQAAIMALVPDEPQEITIQLARNEFMTQRAVRLMPDDILGCDDSPEWEGEKPFNYNPHSYVWSPDAVRAAFTECVPDDVSGNEEGSEGKKTA